MAWYKYGEYLEQKSYLSEFDKEHSPGDRATWSGIYRCKGCGREAVTTSGNPLPPQNHHQHTFSQGNIRWVLLVTDKVND